MSAPQHLPSADATGCIFEGEVPVRVKHNDLDERQASLLLRLTLEPVKANAAAKVVRCRITDEEDPFFLYTLELSEEEFAGLKQEQRLLVDFLAFPGKLVELMEQCTDCSTQEQPRFVAQLVSGGGCGVLSVVEANQFRQLYHISLQFHAGNDASIKRHLAERLADFKAENRTLGSALKDTRARLEASTEEAASARAQLAALSNEEQQKLASVEHGANMALTEEKSNSLRQQREYQERAEAHQMELVAQAGREKATLQARMDAQAAELRELTETKYRLETTESELRIKLGAAETQLAEAQTTLQRSRVENRELDLQHHDVEKTVNSMNIQCATLSQQVQDNAALVQKMTALLEAETEAKNHVQETAALHKHLAEKYERKMRDSIAEINKGNEYIAHLASVLEATQAKVRLKGAVMHQQEELLREKEQSAVRNTAEVSSLRSDVARSDSEVERLQSQVDIAHHQLQENKKLLQNNEKVITYLNRQMNDQQLGSLPPTSALLSPSNGSASSYRSRSRHSPSLSTAARSPSPLTTKPGAVGGDATVVYRGGGGGTHSGSPAWGAGKTRPQPQPMFGSYVDTSSANIQVAAAQLGAGSLRDASSVSPYVH